MGRKLKKNLIISLSVIFIIDIAVGYFLFKSRAFSHLAIWNIMESGRESDFYWKPQDAPGYFYFDSASSNTEIFKNEIRPLIGDENNEFRKVIKIAGFVTSAGQVKGHTGLSLKWDSPEGMLRQVNDGQVANCFQSAIIFSSYLSSISVKSRLWALENEGFNARSHTINEVYIKDLDKWVFIDTMNTFYVTKNGRPLTFLEFRKALLDGDNKILINNIQNEGRKKDISSNYRRLVRSVFLRTGNDFINKYQKRYGALNVFKRHLDALPDSSRRGIDYLCGRHDKFIHYVDKYSKSFYRMIFLVKSLFYCLILSPFVIFALLAISLSRKETRHK